MVSWMRGHNTVAGSSVRRVEEVVRVEHRMMTFTRRIEEVEVVKKRTCPLSETVKKSKK